MWINKDSGKHGNKKSLYAIIKILVEFIIFLKYRSNDRPFGPLSDKKIDGED